MNILLLSAGILSILVGIIHSVLGDILIFKYLRNGTIIPTSGKPLLEERRIRILWATWHIVTILGWAMGGVLLKFSFSTEEIKTDYEFVIQFIAYAMLASSALVLVATSVPKTARWTTASLQAVTPR